MSISFNFPASRENFESFEEIEAIRRQLQIQSDAFSHWKCKFRVQYRHRHRYIYARCKGCRASLRYKWNEEERVYRLTHFNNSHRHQHVEDLREELKNFVKDLPLSVELATARHIAVTKFHVTPAMFYHAYSRFRRLTTTLEEVIRDLEKKDYDLSVDPFPLAEGQLPQILVIISPQMKENFRQFGQTVSYDLTYNVIRDIAPGRKQYAVGIFTGVNCYNKIIPFGITITCEQTTEAFCKIFETFIDSCGQPLSFITDEQPSMLSALNRLQQSGTFKGSHLIDSFHVIRNFGKTSERMDLMKSVSDLIREESYLAWELKIEQLKKDLKTSQQLKAYNLFYAKRHKVCFSQLPRGSFVIFNPSNSINEKMNDLIKCRIRSQKPYVQVVRVLVEFCEGLSKSSRQSIDIMDSRLDEIFEDPELRLCRYLLAKRPMQEFLRQYVSSLSLRPPSVAGDIFVFQEEYNVFQCSYSGGIMDCSCGYRQKTGIGCKHMIWICRKQKISYMESVHERWKIDMEVKALKKRGPNRLTRRK